MQQFLFIFQKEQIVVQIVQLFSRDSFQDDEYVAILFQQHLLTSFDNLKDQSHNFPFKARQIFKGTIQNDKAGMKVLPDMTIWNLPPSSPTFLVHTVPNNHLFILKIFLFSIPKYLVFFFFEIICCVVAVIKLRYRAFP